MPRIIEMQSVTLKTEIVAPRTEILWDPQTNNGIVIFHTQKEQWIDEQYLGLLPTVTPIQVTLPDLMGRVVMVDNPATGEQIPVPMVLVMGAIKAAFNDIVTEMSVDTPLVEPTPEE